ncbi:MAG: hypothetical protein ACJ796_12850 [Gemmatimonadaceae bacterium]
MRRHMLAALTMLLVACGGDTVSGPAQITGTYTLRTVNGSSLPATFYQDEIERDDFFAGNVSLASDNSWTGSLSVNAVALSGGTLFNGALPVSGTYSLNTGSITLSDAAHGLVMTGTISGGTLTVSADLGATQLTSFVFTR